MDANRKKTGGRKKGSLNKWTIDLMHKADAVGCDPFTILCHYANANWKDLGYKAATRHIATKRGIMEVPVITDEMRLKAATELAQYLYPKRRAVEVSGSLDVEASGEIAITRQRVEEALKKDAFTDVGGNADEVCGSD